MRIQIERPHYGAESTVTLTMDQYEFGVLAELLKGDRSGLAYRPEWIQDILRLAR